VRGDQFEFRVASDPAAASTPYKSMKMLEGGTHQAFSERDGLFAQAHVTKGYVLASLGAHNDVDRVRIVFRSKSVNIHYLLDSLEFSEWIFKP
jgi:hypothetical protein